MLRLLLGVLLFAAEFLFARLSLTIRRYRMARYSSTF